MLFLWWLLLCLKICCFSEVHAKKVINKNQNNKESFTMASSCSHMVSCQGKLFHHVQMARIFNDSKTFVDMKLKKSSPLIEKEFQNLLIESKGSPSKEILKDFILKHFDDTGTEFTSWVPEDWKPTPKFVHDVYDRDLRKWVTDLNAIWKNLGRKISPSVKEEEDLYSLIYLPNPFVVPGGRFREPYYWDSYWIIEGLLLSEMHKTARGMIENFVHLVDEYGYVPNGGRKYYLGRSQPPLLIPMAQLYWDATSDIQFLKKITASLEKEFQWWLKNRSTSILVDGLPYQVFQYKVNISEPRPESYYEDIKSADYFPDSNDKELFYQEIRSAAESGWDFSSRWQLEGEEHTANLTDTRIKSLVPVCLNSIMGMNANILSKFFKQLDDEENAKKYEDFALNMSKTISRVLWSERDGIWLDYNLETKKLQPGFYPSNFMPLWAEMYGTEREKSYILEQALAYINRYEIEKFPGGIPTSLMNSGQQWDLPNGWAPLQHIVVLGFHKASKHHPDAEVKALTLATNWVVNNYNNYKSKTPHVMMEKYDVTSLGVGGGGGEYENQEGFGWSNGVVMKFLNMYGHRIRVNHDVDPAPLGVGVFLIFYKLMYLEKD
ncbi:unnamed protein product, partial [Meganyctiphanes norvegica]